MFDSQDVKEENSINSQRQHEQLLQSQQIADTEQQVTLNARNESSDLTRWQQDIRDELERVIHDLRNEIEVSDGIWEKQQEFKGYDENNNEVYDVMSPVMNELGIKKFISFVRPLTSRNLMMSNYQQERILSNLRRLLITWIIHLGYNREKYEVTKGDLSYIVTLVKGIIEPAHWRSLNNGERSYLNTINKRVETFNERPPENKKGFFGL